MMIYQSKKIVDQSRYGKGRDMSGTLELIEPGLGDL